MSHSKPAPGGRTSAQPSEPSANHTSGSLSNTKLPAASNSAGLSNQNPVHHTGWEDHQHELKLFAPKEFSFKENLKYLQRSPNECLFHVRNDRIYRALPLSHGEDIVVIEVREAPHEQAVIVRFLGDFLPVEPCLRADAAAYVRDWFDMNTDLVPFYEMASADPLLRDAVQTFYGLRNMGIPDLFEALCWGILGQQINLTYAYTLKRRFVEAFGRRIPCEGESYWIFPRPEDIAALSVHDLSGLRMTVKKCEYVLNVAKLMADGALTKEKLLEAGSLKQAENMLIAIRGIGPWTANYVLMRCLRMPDAFPIDDVGLHNAIKHVMGMEKKPTKEEIRKLSARWVNWESYATFYLWRFLY
ncbi:DNA-3-methyladenine glycosylase family protein [Paenibacillus ihbetae]|uniref:DNA-3-methyladenine glycosylase family protein n=1 Tax=Paenibacillus ihbetae TaxID=1870820 RepID=UPI000C15D040|nr:DNA-3-methyladenine glycosylase [Paenibacillus ihbetae]